MAFETEINEIVNTILADYKEERITNRVDLFDQPDTLVVQDILTKMMKIVYPGYFRENSYRFYNTDSRLTVLLEDVMYNLNKQITIALKQKEGNEGKKQEELEEEAQRMSLEFFRKIPKIREYVETDVIAAFEGDPAAFNYSEIILCYPGLYAITTNRIAHELYLLGIPLIPRMMTEYAHSRTGIDIHPGASIGKYFFIDHGTGIVIGETTEIGEYVKIYQGVTLGGLSTRGGQSLKGTKRHPTIKDRVTIYSGASIFGGETVIGEGVVIGSSTFITSSIEAGARVSIKNQEMNIRSGNQKDLRACELEDNDSWYCSCL
ncbi:MAG: serine acetyltransferase [Agathobacter sp.]|nr:serine acetyltransferase [Agathobacter sp.]